MKYLIDSDILIGYLKNIEECRNLLDKIDDKDKSTSIINIGEILEGFPENKYQQFREFVETFTIWGLNWEEMREFAKLRAELRKQGNLIDNMDLLVAATCLVNKLTLITGNVKHFQRIPGLKIKKI